MARGRTPRPPGLGHVMVRHMVAAQQGRREAAIRPNLPPPAAPPARPCDDRSSRPQAHRPAAAGTGGRAAGTPVAPFFPRSPGRGERRGISGGDLCGPGLPQRFRIAGNRAPAVGGPGQPHPVMSPGLRDTQEQRPARARGQPTRARGHPPWARGATAQGKGDRPAGLEHFAQGLGTRRLGTRPPVAPPPSPPCPGRPLPLASPP